MIKEPSEEQVREAEACLAAPCPQIKFPCCGHKLGRIILQALRSERQRLAEARILVVAVAKGLEEVLEKLDKLRKI